MNNTNSLSHSATARALRALIITNGAWGAWAQMVSLQTAVFTGYVLWLGASEASIAHFVSIGSFSSLAQIFSSAFLVHRLRHKKAFVIGMGCLHTLFRFSVVLVPLVLVSGRVPLIGVLVGLGMVCWHTAGPIFSGWNAQIIPEDIRARFIGRQTMANLLLGIVASYAAGWYLDLFADSEKYTGFFTVFLIAAIVGCFGFLNLSRVPFREPETGGHTGSLWVPFRDRRFRNLLAFFWVWNFAWSVGSPFYSVFMLKTLQISYTTVAILSSLFMAAMVVGSQLLGGLIDRFGSKAMLQILAIPCALTPILWTFNRPDFYWFIPVAMVLNGLIFAGVLVSVNALLYATVPEGNHRTSYFAGWSCAVFLAYAVAPLLGSALVEWFASVHFSWLGFDIGNMQLVFLMSAGIMVIPNVLLRRVEDGKNTTPGQLLGQVGRGNLVGYVYNSVVYDWTRNEAHRARAVRKMGASRSPMALERLIEALADPSPEVRRQAARGLGEARSAQAIEPLLNELNDEESDIRDEAVEALGKIGDPNVIDPLLDALGDSDTRVQISAIRALSEMGGDEAREVLFWKFADSFDRATFPTLADVLGAGRDLRMVRPTLERLARFKSSAIRLQLLNSVCRALGARRRFYRMLSQDRLARAQRLGSMLSQTRQAVRRTRLLPRDTRNQLVGSIDAVRQAYELGDTQRLDLAIEGLADTLTSDVDASIVEALGEAASRIGASVLAIRTFLKVAAQDETEDTHMLFLIVMLWCMGDAIKLAK